jgi:hypothetical protein
MNDWTPDVEEILENIRINSVSFSNYHKERYYCYKSYLKYFKLPLIVLSSITSIASLGLAEYLKQQDVSLITCLLSLLSAIIASIELYLGIQKSMENEFISSQKFTLIAYNIFKTLRLKAEHRSLNGIVYLDEIYQDYIKIVENSKLVHSRRITDALAPIPEEFKLKASSTNSSSSSPNGSVGLELQSIFELNNV